ncbi:hypothetical protein, partial [Pseudonocardia oceani]
AVFAGGPRLRRGRTGHVLAVEPLDDDHARPAGASDDLVSAVGALSEALERIERARGALYEFHQLMGGADAMLDDVTEGLRAEGHADLAERIESELVGRNVLAGRWTFQIVEEFDDGYYATWRELERTVRDKTMDGRRHVLEAEMKQRRRTAGRPGHEATPGS